MQLEFNAKAQSRQDAKWAGHFLKATLTGRAITKW